MIPPPVARVLALLLDRPALGVQTMYHFKLPGSKFPSLTWITGS